VAKRKSVRTPTHRCLFYDPRIGRTVVVSVTLPTGRLELRGYCKYCYSTHRDWWQMRPEDYGGEDVVLCGRCEHTTLKEFVAGD
jgi:hypothetical protein